MDLRRSKNQGRSREDRIDPILCGRCFGSTGLEPRIPLCPIQSTFPPGSKPLLRTLRKVLFGKGTHPLCSGRCQSHRSQRIRVPGVSPLAQGGSGTIRTTPIQNVRMETVADAEGETPPRSIATCTVYIGIHATGLPCHEISRRIATTPRRSTWWTSMVQSTHAREDGPSSSCSTCHPCVRLHTCRREEMEPTRHRPIDGRHRPSHRIIHRTCVPSERRCSSSATSHCVRRFVERVRLKTCEESAPLLPPSMFHVPFRNVANRSGWSGVSSKARNHVGREGMMRPCSCMQGPNAIGGAHVRRPCVMAILSFALVTGSGTVGWRRGSHRLVSRFRSSSNSSSFVPRSHAWLLSIAGCWLGRHAGMDGVLPSILRVSSRG